MLCVLFEDWMEKQIVSLQPRGFDCRNTSNYVPLLPFPYRIFNSTTPSPPHTQRCFQQQSGMLWNCVSFFSLFDRQNMKHCVYAVGGKST